MAHFAGFSSNLGTSDTVFALSFREAVVSLVFFLLIIPAPARSFAEQDAQDNPRSGLSEDLFFAVLGEANMNARRGAAAGGGLAIGFGDGTAFGGKFLFSGRGGPLTVTEAALFFRGYLPSLRGRRGFFAQGEAGTSIVHEKGRRPGDFCGGLTLGWRFLFRDRWFVEPYVRAGYPFIAGGGIGAGIRR
jgi:hypothetical protein